MAVTTYPQWLADGKRAIPADPVSDLIATCADHGVLAEWYPDDRHLIATPPEDHTPYSHTPWPGPQPYPFVLAVDIVGPGWAAIGQQMVADKAAGAPGTEAIKYINWTDSTGQCWEDSWMAGGHHRAKSTDRNHTHVSFRTDYAHSRAMLTYSPFPATPTPPEVEPVTTFIVIIDGPASAIDPAGDPTLQPGAVWLTNGPTRWALPGNNVHAADGPTGPSLRGYRGWQSMLGQPKEWLTPAGDLYLFGGVDQAAPAAPGGPLTAGQLDQVAADTRNRLED